MNIINTQWQWRTGLATRSRTDYIVLHHAAAVTCTAEQVDSWHKGNGWTGIGYHFFIRKDGSIYRGRPEWAVGAHAEGKNTISMGVCAEGNYETEKTMPNAQKKAIKELLTYLKGKYPNAGIKGHKEVGATGCPGRYYPFDEMKNHWIKNESEDKPMTTEERKKFNEMVNIVSAMQKSVDKLANPMIYNYVDDNMPDWARPTITKLVTRGILQGDENGCLNLDTALLRILVINDRAGAYDKE